MSALRARMAAQPQASHLIPTIRKKEKVKYTFLLLLRDRLKLHVFPVSSYFPEYTSHGHIFCGGGLDNVAFILVNPMSDLKLGILILE